MAESLSKVTYIGKDGKPIDAYFVDGRPLTKKRETFCQLVAFGELPREAVRRAYFEEEGRPSPPDSILSSMGSELMRDADVLIRIQELRRPILKKYAKQYDYTLQKALEQCQRAWDLAEAQADPRAMLKAIELQGKFAKLLTDQVNVTHRHGLLADSSTAALLAMKEAFEVRTRQKVASPKLVGTGTGNDSTDPHEPPFSEG